jgi:hypothetical protein
MGVFDNAQLKQLLGSISKVEVVQKDFHANKLYPSQNRRLEFGTLVWDSESRPPASNAHHVGDWLATTKASAEESIWDQSTVAEEAYEEIVVDYKTQRV